MLNMILDWVMGVPTMPESLTNLVEHMRSNAPTFSINLMGMAKAIGLLMALCVGSYYCWLMMLGRKGLDVLKLLRIAGFSICISLSPAIVKMVTAPGDALESIAKSRFNAQMNVVMGKELQLDSTQKQYQEILTKVIAENLAKKEITHTETRHYRVVDPIAGITEGDTEVECYDDGTPVGSGIEKWFRKKLNSTEVLLKSALFAAETSISDWLSSIIRWLAGLIFLISILAVLLMKAIFINILSIFLPIIFALSIAPPFSSAWSQYLAKIGSLSLYGFVAYMIAYYCSYIMDYGIQQDINGYNMLLSNAKLVEDSWSGIMALGFSGFGTTCFYVLGMLLGAKLLGCTGEVASWLIPGGVSSSGASTMGAMGGAAVGGAVGASMAAAGALVATPIKAGLASVTGGAVMARKFGNAVGNKINDKSSK